MHHGNSNFAREAWGTAPAPISAADAQTRFMDETDAAAAGDAWLMQSATSKSKIEYMEAPDGRRPRVKWVAMFDECGRLTHAILLTRDDKNWTQLTRVEV